MCLNACPAFVPFQKNCFLISILQAPQSQGEHNSLIQKRRQACKLSIWLIHE